MIELFQELLKMLLMYRFDYSVVVQRRYDNCQMLTEELGYFALQ